MIIDTDKLEQAIRSRDDNCDWEKMPMSRLNWLEKRCLQDLASLEHIENLAKELTNEDA